MKQYQTNSNRLDTLAAMATFSILLLALPALAQTERYWSGGGNSDNISDSGNWFSPGTPACGDNLNFNNTTGSHHYVYDDYGCQYFGNFVQYSGAGYIRLYASSATTPTYLYKFENNNEANLFECTSLIESRTSPDSDLQINPAGSGGVAVNNVIIQNGRQLQVYGAYTLTVNGVISQSGSGTATLAMGLDSRAPTVVLKAASTFSGNTYIDNGTLQASISGALPNSAVNLGNTTGTTGGALNLDGGLTWNGQPTTVRSGSSGTKTIANTSGTSGTATYNNNLTLNDNATLYANASGAVTLSGSALDLQSHTLTVDGGGNSTISGTLQNTTGTGALVKNGSGTSTLNSANTYSGGTTIKAGQITISGGSSSTSGPLGPNTANVYLGDTTGSAAATLAFSSTAQTHSYPLIVQSGSTGIKTLANSASTAYGWSGSVLLNDSLTLDSGSGSGSINMSGAVTGNGGVTVNVSNGGTGYVQLSKASSGNTYAGNTSISQGTLRLGSATAIPTGAGTGYVLLNPTSPNTATFDLHGNNQTINGLASSGTGSAIVDNVSGTSTYTLTIGTSGSSPNGTFSGDIQNTSGTLAVIKAGSGTLTLSGANTYNGNTTISAGTLALGSGGSINNTANLSISAGATFDVSAISSYAVSSSTSLSASGTGTTVGTSAAAIKGGTTVSLGSQAITLSYDGSHPALYISQGTLSLNGNTFTVNKASALAAGTYVIIQQASGTVSHSGTYTVSGTAIGSGKTASIQFSGANVNLVIMENTTTALSRTTGSSSQIYGSALTFTATLTGNGTTPAGNVIFKDGSTALATVALSSGTAAYTSYTDLGVNGGTAHSIAAYYQGDSTHNISDSSAIPISQTITAKALTVSGITAASTTYDGTTTAKLGGTAAFLTPEAPGAGSTGDGKPYTVDGVSAGGTAAGTLAAKDVGTQNVTITGVTVTGTGNGNYTVTQQLGLTQQVTQKALGVTANNDTKTYGQTKSYGTGATAFTSSGLQNSETIGSVTITASGGTATTDGANTYALVPSAATGGTFNTGDYSITYTNGTLTVNPLAVSLTGTRAYDGTTNAAFGILSVANIVGSDSVTVASGSGGLAGANVGSRAITSFGGLALGGTRATNYALTSASGSVAITQAVTSIAVSSSENPSGFKDSISFTAASLPADATSTVIFRTNSVLFDIKSLGSGAATSATTTRLPRSANTVTAEYAGDSNYLGSTNSLTQTVTNHPPAAATMSVTRTAGLSLLVAVSDVMTNWTDVDGDTMTLTRFNLTTTNGVNLVTNSSWILYTNSSNVNDQFSYSLSDGQGGTSIGYVNIVVTNSVTGTNSIVSIAGSNPVTLKAYGIPGYCYVAERATNLSPAVWVDITTNTAATNGIISVSDSFSDLGGNPPTSSYYRLKWHP